jgi:hypothetical protein
MKRVAFIVLVLVFWLSTCKAPEPKMTAPTSVPTQTNVPATETAVPPTPTEVPVSEGKLPAAPFDAQTYVNQEAGFAMDIPVGWTTNETVVGPRGTQILFVSKPELAEAATIPADEVRLSATIYQWDPKNDLTAYVNHWKEIWTGSGFTILDEQPVTLEQGMPAVQFTVQSPGLQSIFLVTALKDQYLVLAGEGNLELVQTILQRLRPVSS